jgi:hypothetical protein
LFTLLDILGLKSVSPDLAKADEVRVYRANPPSLVEKAMRQERNPMPTKTPSLTGTALEEPQNK